MLEDDAEGDGSTSAIEGFTGVKIKVTFDGELLTL